MEADSFNLSREVTPEQDPAPSPATERDEHHNSERIRGSVHQVLDQIEGIAPHLLQFTHKWGDIHKEYATVQRLLKERTKVLDLKERSLKERIVELERKEERLKDVVEREMMVGLLEKSMAEKEKENDVKQRLVSSLLMRMDCETVSEAVNVLDDKSRELEKSVYEFDLKRKDSIKELEDRENDLRLLDKAIKEKVSVLEKKQEAFDAKQIVKSEEMELKRKEMVTELEKKQEAFDAEHILKDEEMELKRREMVSELEKKQKSFDAEQIVKAEEMKLKRKEMLSELENKEKFLEAEQKVKAEEMELKYKEMLAEVEKKEMTFEVELKAKTEEMKVKEKQLEEREKELELKQRELEQVMDKLKEREKERNSACLASASGSSPQQRDKACEEEETEEEPERIKIPDSEFHDFKKTMSSFLVDKIWALYDIQDEMPRLYAKIKRINKSRLSLEVTWLDHKDDESVPVACGRFIYGRRETVSYLTFSHELKPIIHGRNISVNPQEGETWALFKDWSKNPIQHKPPYRYNLVEVVVGFKDHQGVGVTYLGKVEGFVTVFKHVAQEKVVKLVIGPDEMQRFSHRVPSVRLSGEEREGVPVGSFELDPAAVPSYILLGEKEPDVAFKLALQ